MSWTTGGPARLRQLRVLLPLLLFGGSILCTAGLAYWNLTVHQSKQTAALRDNNARTLFRLRNSLSDLLQIHQQGLAERRLAEAALDPNITALAVVDPGGQVLFANRPEWKGRAAWEVIPGWEPDCAREAAAQDNTLLTGEGRRGYAPLDAAVVVGGLRPQDVPLLYAAWDLTGALAELRRETWNGVLAVGAVHLLMAALLSLLLHRRMVVRLRNLGGVLARVGGGDFEAAADLGGRDELHDLGAAVNGMTANLRRQRDELLAAEARFRTALERSPVPVALWGPDGRLVLLSRSFTATYGYAARDLPDAETWWARAYPDPGYRAEVRANWEAQKAEAQGGELARAEVTLACLDGTTRIVQAQAALLESQVLVTFNDITDRVHAEEERVRLEAQALHAQKLESLGSLAGGISHDMNNILGAILGITTVLKFKHADDPQLLAHLETVERASQRGAHLVKGLTEFARKGIGVRQAVDLNALVQQEVDLLSHTTLQRVSFTLDLAPDLPALLGDPNALGGALMNLCVNAVQAMEGGGTLVLATRHPEPGWVELTVADSGPGIPADLHDRIFDPFFTTKPVGQGTGLGLAMVAGVVRTHEGTIAVESAPGKGCRFILRFPLPAAGSAAPEAGPEHPRTVGVPHVTVLVVDDDELVRGSVEAVLATLGYPSCSAGSVQEALDCLEAEPAVGLVILDNNMPGTTGAQGLRLMRARWPDLPVVMASGYVDGPLGVVLKDYPDVPLVTKPFTIKELQAALDAAGARRG